MKKINLLYAISTVLLFGVACNSETATTSQSQISLPVSVEDVVKSNLEQLTVTNGSLVPMASAIVSNKVGGVYQPATNPATGKYYKIGDRIKKGEVLARIVDDSYVNDIAVETKKINWEIAQGEYDKYLILLEKGGVTPVDVKNAELSVMSTKTSYDNALISIEEMKVVAPIDGVIVDITYQTPSVEISSGIELFSIMDYSKMYLDISLSESTMSYIYKGLPVYVSHYSVPNEFVEASIDQLSPAIDTDTRTYKGVILVDNDKLLLKPGMFVKTEIVIDQAIDAIVIPKELISTSRNRKYVFVADGTTAIQNEVTTGIENDKYVEIRSGLSVGDKLIIDGYQTLRNRSKITIQ